MFPRKVFSRLFRGQLVNSASWSRTQTTTELSKAGQVEFRAKIVPRYFRCGQNVVRKHNGPDRIPEEMLIRPVICGAPGGI